MTDKVNCTKPLFNPCPTICCEECHYNADREQIPFGIYGCSTAFAAAKLAAIEACCGITTLPERELLERLEKVFWKGFKVAGGGSNE